MPLVDQRVFGAGIKRKRVAFVPAAEVDPASSSACKPSNVGSTYLSIVLGKPTASGDSWAALTEDRKRSVISKCSVCGQEMVDDAAAATTTSTTQTSHESSIAHQICLEHSHPPSHLDRDHVGLRYMRGHGWDPDARVGLGARREGIRVPIKAREKRDTAGLGLTSGKGELKHPVEEKGRSLSARQIREINVKKSQKVEKLRQLIYGEDLSSYLGPNC